MEKTEAYMKRSPGTVKRENGKLIQRIWHCSLKLVLKMTITNGANKIFGE